jgi:hypothetical protein
VTIIAVLNAQLPRQARPSAAQLQLTSQFRLLK